eukprot:TRINITY_DN4360_c0_g1_i1.p1 TRINITY_DN4360_c0_g1~~TRINITY_DN4360_c0_g1_i1.p1  ORF type:complete len:374 (+),score=29.55 TRINITY_DN4360_c0_g1_i1:96-1217(+)
MYTMFWEYHGTFPEHSIFKLKATSPPWTDDKKETNCTSCRRKFSYMVVRRHHCRNCGGLFCGNCSSHTTVLDFLGYIGPKRVCDTCFHYLKSDHDNDRSGSPKDVISRWKLLISRIVQGKALHGEIIQRIYEGVNSEVRPDLWTALSLLNARVPAWPSTYSMYTGLDKLNSEQIDKINADATRTFPDNTSIQSEEVQIVLKRILGAILVYLPETAYFQGISYIVAVALYVMGYDREEEVFWIVSTLLQPHGPLGPGQLDSSVEFVRNRLNIAAPNLVKHLDKQCLTLDVFVNRWLLTLFSYDLPLQTTVKIWDYILACGTSFAPSLALSILIEAQPALIIRRADGLVKYFNPFPTVADEQQLFRSGFSYWNSV